MILYAQDHTLFSPNRDSYGVLAANENELAACAFERVSVLAPCCGPAGCWCCELAESAFKTGGGAGRALSPVPQSAPVLVSAGCARCGGAVSWLCRLCTFLFQPVACQQVVGFCLAIWAYAGVVDADNVSIEF